MGVFSKISALGLAGAGVAVLLKNDSLFEAIYDTTLGVDEVKKLLSYDQIQDMRSFTTVIGMHWFYFKKDIVKKQRSGQTGLLTLDRSALHRIYDFLQMDDGEYEIGSKVKLVGLKTKMNGLTGVIQEGPVFEAGVEKYMIKIEGEEAQLFKTENVLRVSSLPARQSDSGMTAIYTVDGDDQQKWTFKAFQDGAGLENQDNEKIEVQFDESSCTDIKVYFIDNANTRWDMNNENVEEFLDRSFPEKMVWTAEGKEDMVWSKYNEKVDIDVNEVDDSGCSVVFRACQYGCEDIVKILLSHGKGIDINQAVEQQGDYFRMTPLNMYENLKHPKSQNSKKEPLACEHFSKL